MNADAEKEITRIVREYCNGNIDTFIALRSMACWAYADAAKVAEPKSNNPKTPYENGYWAAENGITLAIKDRAK